MILRTTRPCDKKAGESLEHHLVMAVGAEEMDLSHPLFQTDYLCDFRIPFCPDRLYDRYEPAFRAQARTKRDDVARDEGIPATSGSAT